MDAVELTVDATTETWQQAMDEQNLSDRKTIKHHFTQRYGMPQRAAITGYMFISLAIGFGIGTFVIYDAYEFNKPWAAIPTGCLSLIFTVLASFVLLNAFQYQVLGYGLPISLSFVIIGVVVTVLLFDSFRDIAYSVLAVSVVIAVFSFYIGIGKFYKANGFKLRNAVQKQTVEI